jgi:deoxyribonuclease-4
VLLGAHTSIAGGTHQAPPRAKAIGATAMQIFTKMASRWAERECEAAELESFRAALAETDLRALNAHDSYLINLASPDATLRARSIESFVCELRRCEALGLGALVSHPGNFMDDRASGLAKTPTRSWKALASTWPSPRAPRDDGRQRYRARRHVRGARGDHRAFPARCGRRVGVCIDTAHIFAAGYDISREYDDVIAKFDDVVGLAARRHASNDSKAPLVSAPTRSS